MGEMLLFAWSLETSFDLSKSAFGLKDFFQSHPGDFRVLQPREGDFVMAAGGYDVWGYGPLVPARYGQFMCVHAGHRPGRAEPSLLFRLYLPIYKMVRCRYSILPAITAAGPRHPAARHADAGLRAPDEARRHLRRAD